MDNSSNESNNNETQHQSAASNPALWPFSTAKGPIEGWLRSTMASRTPLIQDCGGGVRLYPPYQEGGPLRTVQPWQNEIGRLCSGKGCEHAVEGCVHCWEDRFRFGDLAGGTYKAPISSLKRKKGHEDGDEPEGYERLLKRPNPTVDGRKFETIMQEARVAMPTDFPKVIANVIRAMKRERDYDNAVSQKKRGRGRPSTDILDIAMLAITRVDDALSYEALQDRIEKYAEHGDDEGPFIDSKFDYARVIEAMNGWTKSKNIVEQGLAPYRFSKALEEIRDRLLYLFSDVTAVVGADGMALSAGATDNARLKHMPRTRAAVLNMHVMYEMRWGIITACRMTWHNRGLGSAESNQLPYLLTETMRTQPGTKVFLGDKAYGSERNRALCLRMGVDAFVELKDSQFKTVSDRRWLTKEQVLAEKIRCSITNPLFCQVYPFRNRFEGWHEVDRSQSKRNLISHADLGFRPVSLVSLRKEAKEKANMDAADIKKAAGDPEYFKDNPVKADLMLSDDQEEIEYVIHQNQWTGRATYNEMLCRQIMTLGRGVVKAQIWYKTRVNFASPQPFQPRPEDDLLSIFRPRIDPDFKAA